MTEPTATFTTEGHTPVLIEDWLPIRELSVESVRERTGKGIRSRPPLAFLHVWWARAPLAATNGVLLTSLLPVWDDGLCDRVPGLQPALERVGAARSDVRRREGEPSLGDLYRLWVLWLSGIRADVVAGEARRLSGYSNAEAFPWKAAFKNKPQLDDIEVLHGLLEHRWGRMPTVLDPTAGGGSIPYTACRFGVPNVANDLNPVAVSVMEASISVPAKYGAKLTPLLTEWGERLSSRCSERLAPFFTKRDASERVSAYLFANTVSCPRTGGPVPLTPNWWVEKSKNGTAVEAIPRYDGDGSPSHLAFRIVHPGDGEDFDPNLGTVARGTAISPWDGLTIDGEYLREEATRGRMWPTMYAVAARRSVSGKKAQHKYFRTPDEVDGQALERATSELSQVRSRWTHEGILPQQDVPDGSKTSDLLRFGISKWTDAFTDRQLLTHGVFVEEWRQLLPEARAELGEGLGTDVMFMLAMMQNKSTNRNSRLSHWIPQNGGAMGNVFARHDFGFRWSFGEFDGAVELYPWSLKQVVSAYEWLVEYLSPNGLEASLLSGAAPVIAPCSSTLSQGSGASLPALQNESVECVNIDPPYYDNVQYAELSDFFYVWERPTIGTIREARYAESLSNKEDEAVANPARFADAGRRRRELSDFDYQQKMQAVFAECHRVLVADGVMVVWFTHKRAEAWDTLATAMMEAGFTVEASWPVSTQQETGLNHARQNSAKSTIMLVCRKRQNPDESETFFEDIEAEVRQAARTAVAKFQQEVGIGGVDLQLATYGPTLSVISRNWPVLSSEPDETGRSRRLRPEEALDVARQEVARLRMARLVGRDATFDPATDFWLMCWETFQAREFPYDEARKLALGVGYDVEDAMSSGLLRKKAGNVELVSPATRGRSLRRTVDDEGRFDRLVDAVHFMLVTYRDDKLAAARTWLADSGYGEEQRFTDAVQAAVNAVPRVRDKKGLTLDEAVSLEESVVGLFGAEVSLPVEAEQPEQYHQPALGT